MMNETNKLCNMDYKQQKEREKNCLKYFNCSKPHF